MIPCFEDSNVISSNIVSDTEINPIPMNHFIPLQDVSSFSKIIKIRAVVLEFVNKLKCELKLEYPDKYQHLKTLPEDHNFYNKALKDTVMIDQKEYFPEIFQYFASGNKALKAIPNLVNQLNIYLVENEE